jgi:hypothetical protein
VAVVELRGVKFNHDDGAGTHDALNIRRNHAKSVTVPEWRRGISAYPQDSPAAYSIEDTSGNTLRIQASFIHTDPGTSHELEIRAVDPAGKPTWPPWLVWLYLLLLLILGLPIPLNVLGRVRERTVTYAADGTTDFVNFELVDPLIWGLKVLWFQRGFVGRFDVAWQWQWRSGTGPWNDFTVSQHRIYVVLREPQGPWSQDTAKPKAWPWTDALDYSCNWAQGATSLDEAAERITTAVNRHPLQSYTTLTTFGFYTYHLTSYLTALGGGAPFSMNCTDCADAVTTFANLMGCDLWEGRFFDIQTREFLTLGGNPAQLADWKAWDWYYHEICWLGAMGPNEDVYDGCLQVDMDDNDTDTVHVPRLPVRMRFGTTGSNHYRRRLMKSGSGTLEMDPKQRDID